MITSEIIQTINDLEARFPVDQWTIGGIRVWPLYRIGLYFGYVRAHQGGGAASGGPGSFLIRAVQASRLMAGGLRYGKALLADRGKNARAGSPADAVFLSDGISFADIGGLWYEKFCDPLMRRLAEGGRSSLLLCLSHGFLTPRRTPSIFLQPRIDLRKVLTRFRRGTAGAAGERLPDHDRLAAHAGQAGIATFLPSLPSLRWQAAQVRAIADLYRSIFRTAQPKIGFVVSYYGTEGMAFNLACRESGIPSVDLQHGVAGELCPPYGRWMRVPPHGYGLLPSVFWCWTDEDAAAIERWSPGGSRGHAAVVGGNPWLQEWVRDDSELVRRFDREFSRAFPDAGRDGRRVLITLQTGFSTPAHLGPLLSAMRTAPASWQWLVRLHPCMLNERGRIAALFRDAGVAGVEIDRASALPLFALLRRIDAHVTHSSATVVEAAAFGVPSVITSPYGAEFFRRETGQGRAIAASTGDDIRAALERLLLTAPRGARPSREGDSPDAGAALSKLIRLEDHGGPKG
jgi:hypothetical protein